MTVGKDLRTSARHRVNLSVRYGTASEFVSEYAKNLSRGGLFIAGAHHLEPLSEVTIEIDLPGLGSFPITGEVAHLLTPDVAAGLGISPGAGIAIKQAPPGFDAALSAYLQRLGRRADVLVFVADAQLAEVLAKAGFQVQAAPPPEHFAEAFVRADADVLAVVSPRSKALGYRQAAAISGAGDVVVEMDSAAELDDVLVRLDAEL